MAGSVCLVGDPFNRTNRALVDRWRSLDVDAHVLTPGQAVAQLGRGDVAVGRLDVRRTLDGVEQGLLELAWLDRRGVRVLNRTPSILAAHDKRLTARRLAAAGVPHPETAWLPPGVQTAPDCPVVLKPRFGSWGEGLLRCDTADALTDAFAALASCPWYRRQGVIVQRLVEPRGYDLRILVAGNRAVGAIRRRARAGDWRTNYSLGGTLERVSPPAAACTLAVAAAAALAADFVGVDLLPSRDGYVVLEVNGAVDFEPEYALDGEDVYTAIAAALEIVDAVAAAPLVPLRSFG